MAAWQDGEVEANGLRIHYARTAAPDANKPALVLAHGFSDDGACWTPLARALEPDYDVIMVDARGHGLSEAPQSGYGAAEQAADLRGVIERLGLRRPAILGHSMGAMTTLVLAGTYPDVPGAILLEDPPDRWSSASNSGSRDSAWQDRMRAWLHELKGMSTEQMIARERAVNPGWSDAELQPWAVSKQRLSLNVLNRVTDAPLDVQAAARNVSCPALLITGDVESGAIISPTAAAQLQALVPQLQLGNIAGAGHSIRRDRFDQYVELVRGFLAGID